MKAGIKTLTAAFIAIFALNGNSQSIPLELEREFLLDAIDILDSYEYSSRLRNSDDVIAFKELFINDDVKLYNDLLGLSVEEELSLPEYIDLMRNNVVSPIVTLKNVRKKSLTDDGKNLVLVLDFDKEVRYNNKCGAILSSNAYYGGKDYNMEMVISMDKNTKKSVITSIKGSIDSKQPKLGNNFAIIEKNDPRDEIVTNNGKNLTFNVFDQAFVPIPYNLNYPDEVENMKVVQQDPSCNKLLLTYHPLRWNIKPHVNISLGKGFSINENSPVLDIASSSLEFGIDFGYSIPMKSKLNIAVFTGIGYSTGKIKMNVGDLNYHYLASASADMDADTYVRYYEISNLKQQISLSHLVVPLYADFSYKFHKYISGFVQLGMKTYINTGSKISDFTGNMFAYGLYPQYGDLIIDAPYMNDFGYSEITENTGSNLKFKGASFDALMGLGVRANIWGPISIEAGVNYQLGLTEIVGTEREPGILRDGLVTEAEAFATYTVTNGTHINLLTDYLGKIKRNSLKLNIGIIFKF